MFSGAQVSLYPMPGNFTGVTLSPPDILFAAMCDLFVTAEIER